MNKILTKAGLAIVLATSLAGATAAFAADQTAAIPTSQRSDATTAASQTCASGENEAGVAYHPGGYCMPGGRS